MSVSEASERPERTLNRRRLVAVAYADMVGYSRLIGLDDAGTLKRLLAIRKGLIDPAAAEHDGRLVHTGGDSLFFVFDSIDGAVRCAIRIQQQIATYDDGTSPDRAILFRFGVDIGDAITDGTDFHGGVVNVAARLQVECPPGGICVTRAVRDHMSGRLDLEFEELGALELKNIAYPVEAFVLRPDKPRRYPAEAAETAVAILTASNVHRDTSSVRGLAGELISELSRRNSIIVIAPESNFAASVARRGHGRFGVHLRNFMAGVRRHTVHLHRVAPTHCFPSSAL